MSALKKVETMQLGSATSGGNFERTGENPWLDGQQILASLAMEPIHIKMKVIHSSRCFQ